MEIDVEGTIILQKLLAEKTEDIRIISHLKSEIERLRIALEDARDRAFYISKYCGEALEKNR